MAARKRQPPEGPATRPEAAAAPPQGAGSPAVAEPLHQLLDAIPEAVFLHVEGRILFANGLARAKARVPTGEDLIGRSVLDFIHPDDLDRKRQRLAMLARVGDSLPTVDGRCICCDGSTIDVEMSSTLIDLGGQSAVVTFMRDVSRSRRTERTHEMLRRLGPRLSGVASSREAAEVVVEAAGEMLGWDAALFAVLDRESDREKVILCYDTIDGKRTEFTDQYGDFSPGNTVLPRLRREPIFLIDRSRPEESESRLIPFGAAARRSESLLFAAIRDGESMIGLLSFQSYTPGAYDQESLETLQLLADYCSTTITRTRAQDALRANEELYRDAIAQANAVPYRKDVISGRYLFAGDGIAELTGHGPDELTVAKWQELVIQSEMRGPTAGLTCAEAVVKFENGELPGWNSDLLLRLPTGELRWLSDSSIPLRDEGGKLIGSLGILQDITERRRALEESKESEQLFRSISDHLPDGLFLVDMSKGETHFVILHANEAAARLRNCSMTHLVGRHLEDIPGRQSLQAISRRIFKVQQDQIVFHEDSIALPGRAPVDVEISARLITYKGRRVMLALERDITERNRAKRDLEQQRAFLRHVIDIDPNMIFVQDSEGRYILVNQAVADAYGAPVEEIIGRRFIDFKEYPERQERYLQDDAAIIGGKQEIVIEEEIEDDGQKHYLRTIKRPITEPDGTVRSVLGVCMNITEIRRAELERREFEQRVQQSQKMESLGMLAGGIAHDFNNLLVGIMGSAGLALMQLEQNSPLEEILRLIENSSQRAAELTQQLLAYAGRGKVTSGSVDLSRLTEDLHKLLEIAAGRRVSIELELAGDLPAIEADATQLRQVVMNLVTNAAEAIGDRAGRVTIATGMTEMSRESLAATYVDDDLADGCYCYLEVRDSGAGMTDATKRTMFDPFFTTKEKGHGLGLATVLGIVRSHHGAIAVDSTPGHGTVIRVYFPSIATPRELRRVGVAAKSESFVGQGTALIVDDEEIVRNVAKRMLARLGYRVMTARHGDEALEVFQKYREVIGLVLLDLNMPRRSGTEVYLAIRAVDKALPIVICSGFHERDTVALLAGDAAATLLQKPYQLSRMSATLARLIRNQPKSPAEES